MNPIEAWTEIRYYFRRQTPPFYSLENCLPLVLGKLVLKYLQTHNRPRKTICLILHESYIQLVSTLLIHYIDVTFVAIQNFNQILRSLRPMLFCRKCARDSGCSAMVGLLALKQLGNKQTRRSKKEKSKTQTKISTKMFCIKCGRNSHRSIMVSYL